MQSTVDIRRRALAATAAVTAALVALATAGPAQAADDHHEGSGGTRAGAAPTGGCAAPAVPGTTGHTLVHEGRTRTYRVHVPGQAGPGRPLPVLLAFHGRGSSAAEMEGFSGLSRLPAIVVYPDGVPDAEGKRAWTGAPYSTAGVDDVRFTGALLDAVAQTSCVDPARVYATGKSNGGGFTGVLACRLAGRVAAVAPVAGAFYRQPSCDPGRPVPVLEIHGTADATIPYGGDAGRDLPAIREWVGGWVTRNGCGPAPATRRVGPDVTVERWTGCRGRAAVEHVAVDGGGHTWPGADADSGGGRTTRTVRAADLVWTFVSGYRLPA